MVRTLYVRVIVYYTAAVLIGVLIAWAAALYLFNESTERSVTEELIGKGEHILQMYKQTEPIDRVSFLQNATELASVGIRIYDEYGELQTHLNWPDEESICDCNITVQQLWETDGRVYTIELIESSTAEPSGLYEIAIVLLIVLVIGSFIILLFARLLIRPIQQVTNAAKQWASGNFKVKIPENGPDEIGLLSKTLNDMAAELSKLDRERQEFVANVSHEFQSPLTVIKGFSSVLLEDELEDAERKRSARIIMQEGERLSKLSDNLLRLVALESDSFIKVPECYDLSEQIRRTVLSFEPMWSSKQLDVEMNAQSVTICADAELLNQVWYNLMSNAIKFTPAGGKISIHVLAVLGELKVHFYDNGLPIALEDRDKIFERFFKADRARDRSIDGNGLGLFIVKKIVAIHRGRIEIDEQDNGKAFIVTLPQVEVIE